MRKYADRKRNEPEEYKVEEWVLLSTKDFKFQIKEQCLEKLMKHFVGPYKVNKIISTNVIELELLESVKIYLVVNVSRVQMYKDQIEGQERKWSLLIVIKGEEEYKVEKILNKGKFRGKNRYLVQQKGYIAEENTWELGENLGNTRDSVEKFKEEYGEGIEQIRREDHKRFCRKNYQEGTWQKCYIDRITRSLTRNIGKDWKETREDKKENISRKKKPQRWLRKKTKKKKQKKRDHKQKVG